MPLCYQPETSIQRLIPNLLRMDKVSSCGGFVQKLRCISRVEYIAAAIIHGDESPEYISRG